MALKTQVESLISSLALLGNSEKWRLIRSCVTEVDAETPAPPVPLFHNHHGVTGLCSHVLRVKMRSVASGCKSWVWWWRDAASGMVEAFLCKLAQVLCPSNGRQRQLCHPSSPFTLSLWPTQSVKFWESRIKTLQRHSPLHVLVLCACSLEKTDQGLSFLPSWLWLWERYLISI